MHWLNEQYERERREAEVGAIQREIEINALLASPQTNGDAKRNDVRNAVGTKLIEWRQVVALYVLGQHRVRPLVGGERLQDAPRAARPYLIENSN